MSLRHNILRFPRKGELASLALGIAIGGLVAAEFMDNKPATLTQTPTVCETIPGTWGSARGINPALVRRILGSNIKTDEIVGGTTGYAYCASDSDPTLEVPIILLGDRDQEEPGLCFQLSPTHDNLSRTVFAICLDPTLANNKELKIYY